MTIYGNAEYHCEVCGVRDYGFHRIQCPSCGRVVCAGRKECWDQRTGTCTICSSEIFKELEKTKKTTRQTLATESESQAKTALKMSDYDLKKLLKSIKSKVEDSKGEMVNRTICMFDLSESTPLKLRVGHTSGTKTALLHNHICREIVRHFGGAVVKELGDGILIKFDDPSKACRAAIDIKIATMRMKNCLTKAGLTSGMVEEIAIEGILDVLGATVDRCARLQGLAAPEQILVDTALHDAVVSVLKDDPKICFSQPKSFRLKGIGQKDVYELSTKECGFVGWESIPFNLQEEGRLLIKEKVAFMQNVTSEVIELGTGLTTFSGYFTSRRPAEFKNHVIELLKRGVTFKCLALDPDSAIAEMYAKDRQEENLIQDIRNSIGELQKQREEFLKRGLKGLFEIYVYNHFPYFHAVCVDPYSDKGRMTVSHYMHGMARAEAPVMQFSKSQNPLMFNKYKIAIEKLLSYSKKLV